MSGDFSRAFLIGGGVGWFAAAVVGGSLDGSGNPSDGHQLLKIDRTVPPVTPYSDSLRAKIEALVKAFK